MLLRTLADADMRQLLRAGLPDSVLHRRAADTSQARNLVDTQIAVAPPLALLTDDGQRRALGFSVPGAHLVGHIAATPPDATTLNLFLSLLGRRPLPPCRRDHPINRV